MDSGCGDQCAAGNVGRVVELKDAVGLILAHDITEVVPGQTKGAAFKKGHIVSSRDLDHLARLGKRHLYVLEMGPEDMHEDEAVTLIAAALCGPGVEQAGPPSEGKITLIASQDGLFDLDLDQLMRFNLVPDIMLATIHRHTPVRKGHALAGTRPIPLLMNRGLAAQAVTVAGEGGGLLRVRSLPAHEVGIVVTGNEVASGLIEDRFAPVITGKLAALGSSVLGVRICPDDRLAVAAAIRSLMEEGADLIITTAGMSVDPDDLTRMAISDAGGVELVYGAPVLPGAMFLVGRVESQALSIPILGVPACALFHQTTILDLVLPRVLAGETFDRAKVAALAHGGFCQDCPSCTFPVCAFGRGS